MKVQPTLSKLAKRANFAVSCNRAFSSAATSQSITVSVLLPSIEYHPNIDWNKLHAANEPIIIRGLASQWPAVADPARRWTFLNTLKKRIVEDTVVPLEVGSSYMDEALQKPHVGLGSLLDYLMLEKQSVEQGPRIYLAQHELGEIPVMRDDVQTPIICTTTGKGCLYRSNIWFGGAKGTASPCHFDPFENILCQVVGTKEVTLFAPELGNSHLYPAVGTVQANTSLVDFENPNLSVHPMYREAVALVNKQHENCTRAAPPAQHAPHVCANPAEFVEQKQGLLGGRGTLNPGDAVYIPYKWWHYCKTDQVSCSVNFWWL